MKNKIIGLKVPKNNIILFLVIFFPFLGLLLSGKVIYWGTASLQFIPWYQYFFDTILNGNFPLWNSYNGMGVPFMANYQSAIFYPINWILLLFYLVGQIEGLAVGVTLLIPLHLFIGGLGVMRILQVFERGKFSQLMGGIFFAFSGYILTRLTFISMVWAYAWLPWIIFACIQLKQFRQQGSFPKIIQLSLYLALQLLAGHAQTTYYTIMLAVLIVIFYDFRTFFSQIRKLLAFIAALFISILISAVQIIPTGEFLLQSQRSAEVGYEFAVSLSLWPARLLTIIFGNFWGNPNYGRFMSGGNFWEENMYAGVFPVITIIILIWVLFWRTRRDQISSRHKPIIFLFIALLVFSILFSLGKFFPLFPFLYKSIPTFNLFQGPVRFLIIYFFAFSILLGFAVDVWMSSKFNHKKTIIILVVFGTLLVISLVEIIFQQNLPEELVMSVLIASILGLFFGILTLLKDKSWIDLSKIKFFFGIIVISDLLFHNFLWQNFQPVQIFSQINQEPENSPIERIFINAQYEDFLKFNVFFRPDRLQPILGYEKIQPYFVSDTNLLNQRYAIINDFDPLKPKKFTEFWLWLNTLSQDEQKEIVSMVAANKIIDIKPNKINFISEQSIVAKKLVQWYGCSEFTDTSDTLEMLLFSERDDSENRCLLVNNPSLNFTAEALINHPGEIYFSMPSVNSVNINYTAEASGWIVVRQNWYPGWKAIIDGKEELKIEEVDYLFQGVFTPKGQHSIEFIYTPMTFQIGLLVSCSSLFLLLLWLISYSFHRKSSQKELLSKH